MNKSFPTHAMLLAAGLGERLRPLTLNLPKPLIPIVGRPLIDYNLALLKKFGIEKAIVNLFHLGEKIRQHLGNGKKFGLKIEYSVEKTLLGTGGGVKAAQEFFEGKPFFLMNADILIDVNLKDVFEFHKKQNSMATLVVTPSSREDVKNWIFVEPQGRVVSISETPPPLPASKNIFTGVHVVEPQVLQELLPAKKSCIIQDAYLPLLEKGKKLSGFIFGGYWRDLGDPKRYGEVQKEFEAGWPYTALSPDDLTLS